MKVTAAFTKDEPPKTKGKTHPRASIDEDLARNYPGRNLEELDEQNVSVTPGVPDSNAINAIRRGFKPSIEGGARRSKTYQQMNPKTREDFDKGAGR